MADPAGAEQDLGWSATLRSRWTLLALGSLCYWTATQSLRPMMALRLAELGAGAALIGVILGLQSLVTFAIALPSGRVVDRVGLRRALAVGLAGMTVAGLLFSAVRGVWPLAVVYIGAGVAELAAWLAMQALASHAGTGQQLRRQLALFSFAWGAGTAIGPALGSGLYAAAGWGAVGVLYAAAGVVGGLAGAALPAPATTFGEGPATSMSAAIRTMWGVAPVRAVLLSSFVALFVFGIRNSFYPLLLQRQGLPIGSIGVLVSVIGAASLLVRLPLPALVRRVGAERLLVGSLWLAIVPMTLTPWLGSMWVLAPAAAAVGLGLGVNAPVTVELMAIHTSARERGLAMGLRVSANRLSQLVQPVLFGAAAAVAGMPAAFATGGVVMGVVAMAARPRSGT